MINLHVFSMFIIFSSTGFLRCECSGFNLYVLVFFSYYILLCNSVFLFLEHEITITKNLEIILSSFQSRCIFKFWILFLIFYRWLAPIYKYIKRKYLICWMKHELLSCCFVNTPKQVGDLWVELEENDLHTLLTYLDANTW